MHILFVTPGFPPFTGGGERYAQSLALAVTGRGHTVTVVTTCAESEAAFWRGTTAHAGLQKESAGPLRIIRCPVRPFPGGRTGLLAWRKAMVLLSMLPRDQTRLLLWMAKLIPPVAGIDEALAQLPEKPDLVHGFNLSWEYPLVAGWQFARAHAVPYVVTPFAHFGEADHARVARNATMDHQKRIVVDADAVLALTQVEVEGFRRWAIHPKRAAVAGGGVDPPPPVVNAGAVLQRFNLSKPFVLFLGRVNYDKGAIHAARAVLRFSSERQPLTFVLVGTVAPEFERFWQRLDPQARATVRPLGVLEEAEKHALLQEAAALLLPSRTDSFGIVLLEAWLHSIPVVAARAGGIPGVVDDGQNGLLVPFGDEQALAQAIQRLLSDETLRRSLGEQGRLKVQTQYTWAQVCDRTLDVYHNVLSHKQGVRRLQPADRI